ncbi:hypothetical protein AK972_1526 [Pseudomonas yamanorum]|nr:hypothetical protein AK972_1526 [Pseudomonas yamanorum]
MIPNPRGLSCQARVRNVDHSSPPPEICIEGERREWPTDY